MLWNMTFLVVWLHWCWPRHHMMPMALLHSSGQDNQNGVIITFWVMWFHWCQHQHHMMSLASSMAPLHSLGQDDWNEMQHDFLGLLTPLMPVSVSHTTFGIINGTTAFLRLRWSKWGVTWLFGHVMPLALVSASCDSDINMNVIRIYIYVCI